MIKKKDVVEVNNDIKPKKTEFKFISNKNFDPINGFKNNMNVESKDRIREIMNAMQDLLLYKNEKYGDSALKPNGIFYKGDSANSILVRLDDKIGRIKNNTEKLPRVNDVCDIIGYCTLLLISMGVKKEDIEKFKD